MTAAKETLLQFTLRWLGTLLWASIPMPGKSGIPGHPFIMGAQLTHHKHNCFWEKVNEEYSSILILCVVSLVHLTG